MQPWNTHGFCNARSSDGAAVRNPSCHSVDARKLAGCLGTFKRVRFVFSRPETCLSHRQTPKFKLIHYPQVGAVVVGITAIARLATLAPPGRTGQDVARSSGRFSYRAA